MRLTGTTVAFIVAFINALTLAAMSAVYTSVEDPDTRAAILNYIILLIPVSWVVAIVGVSFRR